MILISNLENILILIFVSLSTNCQYRWNLCDCRAKSDIVFVLDCSWRTEEKTCWFSTMTVPLSLCCKIWCRLSEMRTMLWSTTSLWWSCWQPAPRARTLIQSSSATHFCRLMILSKWSRTKAAFQRWWNINPTWMFSWKAHHGIFEKC